MYKALVRFTDLQDKNHIYHVGDTFPREGFEVSEERLKELSSPENKRGIPVIELVEEVKDPSKKPAAKNSKKKG